MYRTRFLYHKLSVLSMAIVLCGLFLGCKDKVEIADYHVIPLPKEVKVTNHIPFTLSENTIIFYAEEDSLKREADFLEEYISDLLKMKLQMRPIVQRTAHRGFFSSSFTIFLSVQLVYEPPRPPPSLV